MENLLLLAVPILKYIKVLSDQATDIKVNFFRPEIIVFEISKKLAVVVQHLRIFGFEKVCVFKCICH